MGAAFPLFLLLLLGLWLHTELYTNQFRTWIMQTRAGSAEDTSSVTEQQLKATGTQTVSVLFRQLLGTN